MNKDEAKRAAAILDQTERNIVAVERLAAAFERVATACEATAEATVVLSKK